jgi:hypothetical protein
MAKVCPVTKTIVLYADCLDCDFKDECKRPQIKQTEGDGDHGTEVNEQTGEAMAGRG